MDFRVDDPFPYFRINSSNYSAAKEHARHVDHWLGFKIDAIERRIQNQAPELGQTWRGFDPQIFQTPYVELREMTEALSPQEGDHMIELGCAYGRMAHVLHRHFPRVYYTGFEIEPERVTEGQRVLHRQGIDSSKIEWVDLRTVENLVSGDHYFIYDFGTPDAIENILRKIQVLALARSRKVVARGRATRHLIHQNHPWLAEVHTPYHAPHFSIYCS